MLRKQYEDLELLIFELLEGEPQLIHGVLLHRDECDPSVLGLKKIISGKQVHGVHIEKVKDTEPLEGCDGLVTSVKGCGLLVRHADCQAAIFYDPMTKAIANIHAGWRGQVQNIYREAILKMAHCYGSKPENLLVCISPSLGPQSAEFRNYQNELPEEFWPFQVKPTYFDLWAIAEQQLSVCGVLPHHMQIAKIDTCTSPDDFFSYRRDKTTMRNATIIGLL